MRSLDASVRASCQCDETQQGNLRSSSLNASFMLVTLHSIWTIARTWLSYYSSQCLLSFILYIIIVPKISKVHLCQAFHDARGSLEVLRLCGSRVSDQAGHPCA